MVFNINFTLTSQEPLSIRLLFQNKTTVLKYRNIMPKNSFESKGFQNAILINVVFYQVSSTAIEEP